MAAMNRIEQLLIIWQATKSTILSCFDFKYSFIYEPITCEVFHVHVIIVIHLQFVSGSIILLHLSILCFEAQVKHITKYINDFIRIIFTYISLSKSRVCSVPSECASYVCNKYTDIKIAQNNKMIKKHYSSTSKMRCLTSILNDLFIVL